MSKEAGKLKKKFFDPSQKDGNEKEKKKGRVKKAAAVAVAATIAAGAVGIAEENSDFSAVRMPTAIVQDIDAMNSDYNADNDKNQSVKQEVRTGAHLTLAKVIAIPLYAVGAAILKIFEFIAGSFIAPVAMAVLQWAILAAAIIGALALCFKVAFPDIPLGKILNKKCILFILCSVACGSIACEILPIFCDHAETWIFALRSVAGLAVFLPVFCTVMKVLGRHHGKKIEETV